MELPKNGGIVLVDDQVNEIMPLMNALSKKGVSFSYYDGNPKNYPDEPLDCVRLIFLDMHLDEATGMASDKNIISSLMAAIDSLVSENNGPYVIVIWSKHDSQHIQEFRKTVMDNNSLKCRPLAILNMEKANYFETVDCDKNLSKHQEREWKIKKGGLELIEKALETKLESVNSFVVLYNWENVIRQSANKTVESISNLFNCSDDNWNNNLKAWFLKIAKAYAGKNLDITNDNIIKNLYCVMNDIANDFNYALTDLVPDFVCKVNCLWQVQNIHGYIELMYSIDGDSYIVSSDSNKYYLYINSEYQKEGKDINKILKNISDEIKNKLKNVYLKNIAKINSLLHIRNHILDKDRPGNIYQLDDELKHEICEEHNFQEQDLHNIIGIALEISPICDYSQHKKRRIRFLPGLVVPYDGSVENAKYIYEIAPLCIEGELKKMMFDYRYLTTLKIDELQNKTAQCAISDALLQNIKEGVASHGVRSGIVTMDNIK